MTPTDLYKLAAHVPADQPMAEAIYLATIAIVEALDRQTAAIEAQTENYSAWQKTKRDDP